MTDKKKIREEVERLYNQSLADENRQADRGLEYAANVSFGKSKACKELLSFIDSLPEEPVSNPPLNEKMSVERWKKACEAACCDSNYRSHYGLTETRDDYFVDGVQWADEHPKEEPVSEGLQEAANEIVNKAIPPLAVKYKDGTYVGKIMDCFDRKEFIDLVKAGAQWQKQKDNNNANHALVEQIKTQQMCYEKGMADMKQQMMKNAVDGDITFDYYGDDDKTYGCIAHNSFCLEDFGLKDRDKVKVIVIKED